MALSPEKQAQLDALNAENESASEDDEFDNQEIEVWNEKGAGARLKGKHSRNWLIENGFLKAPAEVEPPSGDDDTGSRKSARVSKGTPATGTRAGTAGKYFGTVK
jgi:hypothetical protein